MDAADSDHEEEDEKWNEPAELQFQGVRPNVGQASDRQSADVTANRKPNVSAPGPSGGAIMSRMALNDNKAGMDGLDKDKINKIIMEASKGSRFYENECRKEAQVNQRIDRMMLQLAGITEQQKAAALVEVDAMVADLEASRNFSRSIVHLDMDAFYAAVEMRDDPSLRDKPMAVGGMSMLSTSNYHARRYGARAAMPGFIAKKLCPELIIVPTNFDKYRTVSSQVREILGQYDPNFCPMSLDEAYFDLTDHLEKRQSFSEAERTFAYGEWNENPVEKTDAKMLDADSTGGSDVRDRMSSGMMSDPVDEHSNLESQQENGQVAEAVIRTDYVSLPSEHKTELPSETGPTPTPLDSSRKPSGLTEDREMPPGGSEAVTLRDIRSRTFGLTVEEVVEEIRFRIEQETQLTASAGIAPNVMLAKICSDKNKPNGQYRIQPNRDAVMEFIQELPIRKVSGIGKVTEKLLAALGIQNCTHLYQQRALLHLLFSPTSSQHFLRISLGLGSTRVERDGERKSMSTERTFSELSRPADLYSKCNELCHALAEDLQKEELAGKTVTIKLKTVKFDVKTKASSVPSCISSADALFGVAKDLLRAEINACKPEPLRLRLMGVRLSNLQPHTAAENKQGSITTFFKKQAQTPAPQALQLSESQQATSSGSTDGGPVFKNATANNFSSVDQTRDGLGADLSFAATTEESPQTFQSQPSLPSLQAVSSSSPRLFESTDSPISRLQLVDQQGFPPSLDNDQRSHQESTSRTQDHEGSAGGSSSSTELVCPVCNIRQICTDLEAFNEHVDVCLNRGAIRDMLKQQAAEVSPASQQRHTSPTKGKRSLSGPKSAPKRCKQEKPTTNTLDRFFS